MTADKKTVLIVDDEADLLDYLSTFLTDQGFATETAADGVQALAKVEASPPDLVTLDITMPEKSGVRFYREMRESDQWRNIPIIIVTGVSGDFEKFISSRRQVPPPDGYIAKPADLDQLLKLARELTA